MQNVKVRAHCECNLKQQQLPVRIDQKGTDRYQINNQHIPKVPRRRKFMVAAAVIQTVIKTIHNDLRSRTSAVVLFACNFVYRIQDEPGALQGIIHADVICLARREN